MGRNASSTMVLEERFPLSNGTVIPKLGYGTWLISQDSAVQCVQEAVKIGYRLIDTAQAYGNEKEVGEAIRTCGVPRETIFAESKVAAELKDYDSVRESIDASVAAMDVGSLDMMLIHSPQPWKEVNQSDNRYFEQNREVWRAMEDAAKTGVVKGIGVANFEIEDLENILEGCTIPPAINQILCHAGHTPTHLINWCRARDIRVMAYSPLGHGVLLSDPLIEQMAAKYEVSPAQLCIRYDIQLGTVTIPKASTPERMKQNAGVHFVISDEDMKQLKAYKLQGGYGEASVFPVFGGKL